MRFGWKLTDINAAGTVEASVDAERLGYDLVWVDGSATVSAVTVAASLASVTSGLRVGVTEAVGVDHPIYLAEEAAVADLALGGRLILGVRAAPGTEDSMPEILDLLSECAASHPFRHAGDRWNVPAHLEQNVFNLEDLIRVAPAPAQIELPMWVVGAAGRDAGVERGFGFVADVAESPADLASWWATVRSDHPKLVRRLRRTACWTPPVANGRVVLDDAVSQLRVLQESIGLDLVLVTADDETAADAERAGLMRSDLARHVRPLVQLDRLPPGLADHWAEAITPYRYRQP